MKAMIIKAYGPADVLQEAAMPMPTVGPQQLLIEVMAAGVNPIDWKIRKGNFRYITGRRFPRILGTDVAGIIRETVVWYGILYRINQFHLFVVRNHFLYCFEQFAIEIYLKYSAK